MPEPAVALELTEGVRGVGLLALPVPSSEGGVRPVGAADEATLAGWPPKDIICPMEPGMAPVIAAAAAITAAAVTDVNAMADLRPPQVARRPRPVC